MAIGEKEARLARSRENVWWLQKVREVKNRWFLKFLVVFFFFGREGVLSRVDVFFPLFLLGKRGVI